MNGSRVFDIFEGQNVDFTRLIKWPKHGGANQRFRIDGNANEDYYSFIAVNSNKALGLWFNGIAQSSLREVSDKLGHLSPYLNLFIKNLFLRLNFLINFKNFKRYGVIYKFSN